MLRLVTDDNSFELAEMDQQDVHPDPRARHPLPKNQTAQ